MPTPTNTPDPGGYAGRVVTKAPNWHDLVVLDVLFNNLTTGLFLVAAVGELARPAAFAPVAVWAYPLALVLLVIDLGLLVLDLGDKLRFHHMLRVFKPSSPMSLGTWCLTGYALFLTAVVALDAAVALGLIPADGPAKWARTAAVVGALPFCFGSAAYKGVLFSTTAQPGWRDARWLGAYLLNSAVLLGTAQALVIATLAGADQAAEALRPAVALLAALNLVPLGLLVDDLDAELSRLYSRPNRIAACAALVLVGVAVPVGLLLADSGAAGAGGALLAILAASLGVRFVVVHLPHSAHGGRRDS